MTLPFALPDWVPWWLPLVLLLPALLYALAFLFMPFSVIGVKSRLEVIEARLDELQNEIRHLALRLPAASREADFEDIYAPRPVERRAKEPQATRPPIPPAAYDLPEDNLPEPDIDDRPPPSAHARPLRRGEPPPVRQARSEPRVNWPR
jgi:hypothetical protein